MPPLDPRLTPARGDLAAQHLQGQVQAARYVTGELRVVIEPTAPLRRAPAPDAPLETEALMGERVTVYETTEQGWAWGQLESDGYVGYLPAEALAAPGAAPTHRIAALRTLAFPGPSIKIPPLAGLPFGARIAIVRSEGPFAVTAAGWFLPLPHVAPLAALEADWVAVAERFAGAPYLWGGKTGCGLDCSALVQLALTACGIPCPRDSDMQEAGLGAPISIGEALLRRGDLVFWPGHVGMLCDPETLLHANAHHMAVAVEPLAEAVARIRAAGSTISSVRRLNEICRTGG